MEYELIRLQKLKKSIRKKIYITINKNKELLNLGKIREYTNNCNILVGMDIVNKLINKNIKRKNNKVV